MTLFDKFDENALDNIVGRSNMCEYFGINDELSEDERNGPLTVDDIIRRRLIVRKYDSIK
jgi:hypothetical protein